MFSSLGHPIPWTLVVSVSPNYLQCLYSEKLPDPRTRSPWDITRKLQAAGWGSHMASLVHLLSGIIILHCLSLTSETPIPCIFIWLFSYFRWRAYPVTITLSLPEVEVKHLLFATYFILIRATMIPKYLTTDPSWALTKQNRCWPKAVIWPSCCLRVQDPFCPVLWPNPIIHPI